MGAVKWTPGGALGRVAAAALLGLALALAAPAAAAPEAGALRVGTSGDYAPFSLGAGADPAALEGFDVALARAFAADRGRELELVRFRWPELLEALARGRFELAAGGISVTPERSAAGLFSVPVAESGAVLLAPASRHWREPGEADRGGLRIGVNAGGQLERVARARFRLATLVAIPDNRAVLEALRAARVDAAISDTLEQAHWLPQLEDHVALGPFSRERKAWLVRSDRPALAAELDAWLLEREADGTLARLRGELLGEGAGPPTATPLRALLAACDERLSLMPLVGAAKRREGLPLEVPEREAAVLDAALESARRAAEAAHLPAPPEAGLRRVFEALLDAAKEVQWASVQAGEIGEEEPVPDLESALRPALLRIGERIARLLLLLPRELEAEALRAAALEELRSPHLSERSKLALADALSTW